MMGRWRTPSSSIRWAASASSLSGPEDLRGRGHVVRHRGGHRFRALGHGGRQVPLGDDDVLALKDRTTAPPPPARVAPKRPAKAALAHDHHHTRNVEQAVTLGHGLLVEPWCYWAQRLLLTKGSRAQVRPSPQVVPA